MTAAVLNYGGERIPYEIAIKPERKAQRVTIHVLPDGKITVDAPEGTPTQKVREAVSKKGRWIYTHLTLVRERQQWITPRRYISGESHPYLGRNYQLKVLLQPGIEPFVKLKAGQLCAHVPNKHPDTIKAALDNWYAARAQEVFKRRLTWVQAKLPWTRKRELTFKLRPMKKQWGSCSPKGLLSLNPQLVKAPVDCIDYVLIHELCHIKEHNHSPKFYRLLDIAAPRWRSSKERLDNMADGCVV